MAQYTDKQIRDFVRRKERARKRAAMKNGKKEVEASKMPKDAWVVKTRYKLLNKENEAEDLVEQLLNGLGVKYFKERPIEIGGKRSFLDFLVVSMDMKKVRIAIEVDGGYHFTPEQQAIDRERERTLLKSSRVLSILRITSGVARRLSKEQLKFELKTIRKGTVRRLYV
jgi:very-short-patch-repair endonuclease